MTVQTLVENVKRGAELLDKEYPGWALKIELPTLSLQDNRECILGQLLGNFADGLDELEVDSLHDAAYFGFYLYSSDEEDLNDPGWDTLTNLWRAEVVDRRVMSCLRGCESKATHAYWSEGGDLLGLCAECASAFGYPHYLTPLPEVTREAV